MANTVENIGVIYAQQVDCGFFGMSLTKNDRIQKAILDVFGRVSLSKSHLSVTFHGSCIHSSSLPTCFQMKHYFPFPFLPLPYLRDSFQECVIKEKSTEVKLLKREPQCKQLDSEEDEQVQQKHRSAKL